MRAFRIARLIAGGAISLPLLAGTTSAVAANPRTRPPIGTQLAKLKGSDPLAANALPGRHASGKVTTNMGWSIQTTPNPAGAQDAYLSGVSCKSTSACTAVGYSQNQDAAPNGLTLAEAWNGSKWVIEPTPTAANVHAYVSGVSCTSVTACTAVGYYVNGTLNTTTLAEAWNGSKWLIEPTPNPAGSRASELSGVSCASATACIAVGKYFNSAGIELTLAEAWSGTRWAIEPTPNPAGTYPGLSGVSCASALACTAVGSYVGSNPPLTHTLAEAWNGTRWAIEPIASVKNLDSGLQAISCTSATVCTAVGWFGSVAAGSTLAETWDGTSWAIHPTPNRGLSQYYDLTGVACTSATACTAIGEAYDPGGKNDVTLALGWNGSKWVIEPTPNPAGGGVLSGVSCSSPTVCTAVGSYENSSGTSFTLAETTSTGTGATHPLLHFVAPPVPIGTVGQHYSLRLSATGGVGRHTWSDSGSLPPGLKLDPTTGVISGTPTQEAFSVVVGVHVTDASKPKPQVASQVLSFFVTKAGVPLVTSFSPIANVSNPTIVLEGTDFGDDFPSSLLNRAATSKYLEIFDCLSGSCTPGTNPPPKWTAGYQPGGDLCDLTVEHWSNTEIVLQFDSNPLCPFDTGHVLGVEIWDTNLPVSNSPGPPDYSQVASGYVWGYCLNGQAGAIGALGIQDWGCAVESGPNDVALLWNGSASVEPLPTTVGTALQAISNELNCTGVCEGGGLFAFGSNATTTSQFSSATTYQSMTVGASVDLKVGIGLSAGEGFTLFNRGTTTGLLGGLSLGVCAGCVELPVSVSLGVGPLNWNVDQLSGAAAATVDADLHAMKTSTLAVCVVNAAACPLAFTPYAGYFGGDLTAAFDDLNGILQTP